MVLFLTAGEHSGYQPMKLRERTVECLVETVATACGIENSLISHAFLVRAASRTAISQTELRDDDMPTVEGMLLRVHFQRDDSGELTLRLVANLNAVDWESLDNLPIQYDPANNTIQYHF